MHSKTMTAFTTQFPQLQQTPLHKIHTTSLSKSNSHHRISINAVYPSQLTNLHHSVTIGNGTRIKGSHFVAKALTNSQVRADIADMLGEVIIFNAASGEPVMFKNLLNQNELLDTAEIVLKDLTHMDTVLNSAELDELWIKFIVYIGMTVVALLRHFGCICCWELASSLKDFKPRFDSAGVKLIAVGVGTPKKARILAERLPFPMDCLYADPDRKAYDVLGLYYGIGRTFFNPASAKVFSRFEELQKATKNYTIEATPDDINSVLQQGGMFVFKGKELLYARKDEGTGDHASLDDILDTCCNVQVA